MFALYRPLTMIRCLQQTEVQQQRQWSSPKVAAKTYHVSLVSSSRAYSYLYVFIKLRQHLYFVPIFARTSHRCIILAARKSASEERSEELPSSYNNFPSIIRLIKKHTIYKGRTIQFITIQCNIK